MDYEGRGAADALAFFRFFAPLDPIGPDEHLIDPKVIYDQYAGRFVVVVLERTDTSNGDDANTSHIFLAVSAGEDPNGAWYFHKIDSMLSIGGTDRWADYPGLGVSDGAIYITANMFRFGTNSAFVPRLWIVNKTPLYSGGAATVTVYDPFAADPSLAADRTLQPAHMYGTAPGAVGTFLVGYNGLNRPGTGEEQLLVIRVDDPLTTPTFNLQRVTVGNIDNTAVQILPDAPQLGTTTRIDVVDRRTFDAVWRNNSLWTTAEVLPPSGVDANQTTAHWWQIDTSDLGSLTLVDQSNVGGEDIAPGTSTFFPAIMVDAFGDMAIGFSASAATIYPGAYYAVHLATDQPGTVRASQVLAAGTDYYIRIFGDPGRQNRWGDFSGIALDPSNETAIWVFNEYATTRGAILPQFPREDGRWATRLGRFAFPVSISGQVFNDANANGTEDAGEGGLEGVTVYIDANNNGILDPGEESTTTNFDGDYSFYNLAPGTYVVREEVPSGYSQTAPAPSGFYTVNVVSGATASGNNFGDVPTLTLSGGTLTINGGLFDDTIDLTWAHIPFIGDGFGVTINGSSFPFPIPASAVLVRGLGGNDNITIDLTGGDAAVTVDSGPGDDTVTVLATHGKLVVQGNTVDSPAAAAGRDTVVIGDQGSLANILGPVEVEHTYGASDLTVDGSADAGRHQVTLDANGPVGIDGLPLWRVAVLAPADITYDPNDLHSLTVKGGVGDDTFTVADTAAFPTTTVDSGPGDDTFHIGNGTLDGIQGTLTVAGGGGTDTLTADDSGTGFSGIRPDPGPFTYTVNDSAVVRKSAAATISIHYVDLDSLTLDGTAGSNTYNVTSTAAGTPVTVVGGTGNDTFDVGQAGILDGIQGALTVDGGGGTDTLTVDDSAPPISEPGHPPGGPYTYTVTDKVVARSGAAPIRYSGLDGVTLLGSDDANTYRVRATAQGTPVTIDGGTGNDTFDVGYAGILDGIQGALAVDGGGGHDTLTVDDSGMPFQGTRPDPGPFTYLVDPTHVYRNGAAAITYSAMDGLTLRTGDAGNTVDVGGTAEGTPVTVYGGRGKDRFGVGVYDGFYSLPAGVTIYGGGGADTMVVDDITPPFLPPDAPPPSDVYTLTASTVGRSGAATVTYGDLASVTLYVDGSRGDTYDIQGTASGTPVTIRAGSGTNTFNVNPVDQFLDNIQGALNLVGGNGNDTLNVEDQGDPFADTYSVTASTVGRDFAATITYSNFEDVVLNGGSGGVTYKLLSPAAATPVSINAGAGNDTFLAADGAGIAGSIDGGNGSNTLDYSAYTIGVAVDLTTGVATGVGGGVRNIQKVIGGSGDDRLVSGLGRDVLAGGPGADRFVFLNNDALEDTITDFVSGLDQIDLVAYKTSYSALTFDTSSSPGDTIVEVPTGAMLPKKIKLQGVTDAMKPPAGAFIFS